MLLLDMFAALARVLISLFPMWGSRWSAVVLLFVILAPAFEPLATASAVQPQSAHCMRQASAQRSAPPMPCHHATAPVAPGENAEVKIQASNCCQNHDCCRGAVISQWAHVASTLLPRFSLLTQLAGALPNAGTHSTDIIRRDSARAPPRS